MHMTFHSCMFMIFFKTMGVSPSAMIISVHIINYDVLIYSCWKEANSLFYPLKKNNVNRFICISYYQSSDFWLFILFAKHFIQMPSFKDTFLLFLLKT